MSSFLLLFFRIVIGSVFTFSLSGKLRNIPSFIQTIADLKMVPSFFNKPLAYLFFSAEFVTIITMIIGGYYLSWGFTVSIVMFLLFSIALLSAVRRNIKTTCNCFGSTEKEVNTLHAIRSVGFLICAISGFILTNRSTATLNSFSLVELVLVGAIATLFVLIWTQIGEIIDLVQSL